MRQLLNHSLVVPRCALGVVNDSDRLWKREGKNDANDPSGPGAGPVERQNNSRDREYGGIAGRIITLCGDSGRKYDNP